MLSDPDPTFNFDAAANPDKDPDSTTHFLHMKDNQNFFTFIIHSSSSLQFYLSLQRQRGQNFQYFRQFNEISGEKI